MMILKIIAFGLISITALTIIIKNTNKWAVQFQRYMLGQANKVFKNGVGWDKPWAIFFSKAIVIFFGLMFIVLIYVIIFSF